MTARDDLSAGEAFSMLGNELRVDILRALAGEPEPEDTHLDSHPLTFSELYDRVDATNTSQFAYHLDRLTDTFVREVDDGYRLTYAGIKVVHAALAGTYNEKPTFEPVEVDGLCPACGATTFVATYEGDELFMRCGECETKLLTYMISPGQARDRTPQEIVHSCDRYIRGEYAMAIDNVCSECAGKMDRRIRPGHEHSKDQYLTILTCKQCGHKLTAPIETHLPYHPAVISFYWERGRDVTRKPFWELFEYIYSDRWQTELLSEDPYRFRVVITLDGDELAVELDEDLQITSVTATETLAPRASETSR